MHAREDEHNFNKSDGGGRGWTGQQRGKGRANVEERGMSAGLRHLGVSEEQPVPVLPWPSWFVLT